MLLRWAKQEQGSFWPEHFILHAPSTPVADTVLCAVFGLLLSTNDQPFACLHIPYMTRYTHFPALPQTIQALPTFTHSGFWPTRPYFPLSTQNNTQRNSQIFPKKCKYRGQNISRVSWHVPTGQLKGLVTIAVFALCYLSCLATVLNIKPSN